MQIWQEVQIEELNLRGYNNKKYQIINKNKLKIILLIKLNNNIKEDKVQGLETLIKEKDQSVPFSKQHRWQL